MEKSSLESTASYIPRSWKGCTVWAELWDICHGKTEEAGYTKVKSASPARAAYLGHQSATLQSGNWMSRRYFPSLLWHWARSPGSLRRGSEGRIHVGNLFNFSLQVLTKFYRRRDSPITFRLHLKSLSSHTPHPKPLIPILEYDCDSQWSSYSYVVQIMGNSLGALFTSGVLGDSDYERFIVWDWTTGVKRGVSICLQEG